jgi:hypothetical protein
MTEAEWLSGMRASSLLGYLLDAVGRDRPTDRRFRAFACACLREVYDVLPDRRSRQVVDVAEQFANGLTSRRKLEQAARAAGEAAREAWFGVQEGGVPDHLFYLANAASELGEETGARAAWSVCHLLAGLAGPHVPRDVPGLIREVFGNPFRSPALPDGWRAWNRGTVVRLAQQIREEQRFDEMPVLGDALEEAGCTDTTILDHCRSGGHHVAGCWVLDLLLAEE